MRKTVSVVLPLLMLSALVAAQTESDIDKKLEEITQLINDSKVEEAVAQGARLVASSPYAYSAHMMAFQANLAAYRKNPSSDRKSTRLNSSHSRASRMPSSA